MWRKKLIDFSTGQLEAISAIFNWYTSSARQEFYLAGYAGTGKTTIAAHLINQLQVDTCVATYTGKAASVLRKKGIGQAQTIHSLIYMKVPDSDPVEWCLSPLSPLADSRLLVVDEVSMVNDEMADDLRSYGKKILVLGDPGQLPPIHGAGAFTRSDPEVMLTEIHRQAAQSPVLAMATAARLGQDITSYNHPESRIGQLIRSEVVGARGQVICGTHRSRWGATKIIREKHGFTTKLPNVGERVICRRNDRELGVYNGMLGEIKAVYSVEDDPYWNLVVQMDDLRDPVEVICDRTLFMEHSQGRLAPPYYSKHIQLFDFGYVITCHSAQGSEWPEVTIIDDSGSFREERDRWLYTAITRAAERVTILRR